MESNCGIGKLLELFFDRKPTIPDKMFAHLSIPSSWLNQGFSKKLECVLRYKTRLFFFYFQKDFDEDILEMTSSHEKYVVNTSAACHCEYESNKNVFEKFLSVCAIVKFFSEGTLQRTGLNFCGLNPDIIIMFYQSDAIQSPFPKRKDFRRFVDFICTHRYLQWNWDTFDHTSPDGATASSSLDQRIKEEMGRFYAISRKIDLTMTTAVESMAKKILSNTSVKLPKLPSKSVLVQNLVASRKKEMAKQNKGKERVETAITNETLHGNSSSNSDSKQIYYTTHEEIIERHENIVQAVIRYNHSNISRHDNVKCKKQIEAEATLEDLKTSIKSLIDVLDEFKQE